MVFSRYSLTAAAVLLFAPRARAQDIPYANYLVGDRALGLGGAFVGLADDASASFHNPAGLSLVSETAISASFWVAGIQHRSLQEGFTSTLGRDDLSDTDYTFPPLVVTAVAQVGARDPDGRSHHAIGAALLKPLRQEYRSLAVRDDGGAALASLDVDHDDNARWYGLSYAYRPGYRLSFGASAFIALRDLDHEEFEVHDDDTAVPADRVLSRHSVFSASMRDLIWRFGVTWDPVRCVRLGAMFQLPGIAVGGSADNREMSVNVDALGATTATNVVHDNVRTAREIPWELRLGASWFFGARGLITADVAIHGSAGSEQSPIALLRAASIPPPRMLALESYRDTSARVAVGGEYVYRKLFPLRGGVLVYTSGAPGVPAMSDAPSDSDMLTLGLSVSGGMLLGEGRQVSIGTAVIHATGTGSALDQSGAGPSVYRAADISETTVLVFVSGGVQGAKKLAQTLAAHSGEWMEGASPPARTDE